MKKITQIKSLFVNNTNQVEVIYDFTDVDAEGFKVRGTEGRVWSPTDDMAGDTLSGAHPDVLKLAKAYWSKDVVKGFSAAFIALQDAERKKIETAIAEQATVKETLETAIAEVAAAQTASEEATAAAKLAADAAEIENKRLADALAVAKAAEDAQVAADKAAADKQAFDDAVAAQVAKQVNVAAQAMKQLEVA